MKKHRNISVKKAGRFIIFFGVVAFFAACGSSTTTYNIKASEMIGDLATKEYLLPPTPAAKIINSDRANYRFIDLRTRREYDNGHIEGAININTHDILEDKNLELLRDEKYINVLYHSNHAKACSPWMLLRQLGMSNNKLLVGGYDYAKEFIIDKNAPESGHYRDEGEWFDFPEEMKNASGGKAITSPETVAPLLQPVKKKKKKSAEGGC